MLDAASGPGHLGSKAFLTTSPQSVVFAYLNNSTFYP